MGKHTLTPLPPVESLLQKEITRFLVLDYDGVLNASARGTFKKQYFNPTYHERHPNPYYVKKARYWEDYEPKTYELAWSAELVSAVNDMASSADTLVVWLTTWREHMGAVMQRMGLCFHNEAYYLPWGEDNRDWHHAKKRTAFHDAFYGVSDLYPTAKAIWVDDEAFDAISVQTDDCLKNTFIRENVLLVKPDCRYGISRAELDTMKHFWGNP